jgi:hypothetical protein
MIPTAKIPKQMGYTVYSQMAIWMGDIMISIKFGGSFYLNLSDPNRASNRITEPLAGLAQAASTSAPQQSCTGPTDVQHLAIGSCFFTKKNQMKLSKPPPQATSHTWTYYSNCI